MNQNIKNSIEAYNKELGNVYKFSKTERISISQIKDALALEFDKERVAKKTYNDHFNDPNSIYYQKSIEEIIEMWEAKGDKAKAMGNLVDDFVGIEYDNWDKLFENDNQISKYLEDEDPVMCRKYNGVHRVLQEFKKNGLSFETRELPLYLKYPYKRKTWLINGRFDAIFSNAQQILIVDWKNSEDIKEKNPWQKMLGPCKEFDDCDWYKFTIQVYMYIYILRWAYNIKIPMSACIVQFPGQKDYYYKIFKPAFDYSDELMKKIIEYAIDQRIKKIKEEKKKDSK